MRELLRRVRWLFHRNQFERDLDEEMQHHLALQAEAAGKDTAIKQFGNLTLLKENSRAMWTFVFWEQLMQDIRYGFRTMASNKLFTAMAVLSLALGIGANTAIYSFLDAILMRSLPVKNPERLVLLNWRSPGSPPVIHGLNGSMFRDGKAGRASPNFPFAAFETLREKKEVVSALFAYAPAYEMNLLVGNQAEVSAGVYVSGNYYAGLGVEPAAGRLIADDDDKSGAAHVVVIAYKYWRKRFASDPSAIGQTIQINNLPFTIIGVSAPGFFGIDSSFEPTVFLPLHCQPLFSRKPAEEQRTRFLDRNFYWLEMMGRLQPGASVAQAQTVLGGFYHQFVESTAATPKEKSMLPALWAAEGAGGLNSLRRRYSQPLYILMSMVGLILVIACANIANLLLARATARRREIAIRLSLGAGRMRVIRQLLTESVLMSLSGGLLGLAIAVWAIRSISWLLSDGRENMILRAELDWRVLAFTASLALITGIVFGLAPAIQVTGRSVTPDLKEAKIGGWRGRSRFGMSQTLIVVQMAISLLLVVAAGLFVRTLSNLHSVELGFNREHVLTFRLNARPAGYKGEALARFYADIGDRFRHIPGVKSAGLSNSPVVAGYWNDTDVTIPGMTAAPGTKLSSCLMLVDESFLSTMQIPILLGRGIQARDITAPRAAVVSELFAKKYFPGGSPLARHFTIEGGEGQKEDLEIVGIAKKSIYNSVTEETPPVIYVPYTLDTQTLAGVWFELRTAGDPLAVASAVRSVVHLAAAGVPIANLKTQAAQIDQTIAQERMFANLCACFAILALIIAGVGLYGTMAYAVERRTGEIGIRMALGAKGREIIWMMLRQVLLLAAVGIAIGLFAARQTAHFVESFLFGMKADDPLAFWGSAAILLLATLVAAFGPARRAATVDPMVALRNE